MRVLSNIHSINYLVVRNEVWNKLLKYNILEKPTYWDVKLGSPKTLLFMWELNSYRNMNFLPSQNSPDYPQNMHGIWINFFSRILASRCWRGEFINENPHLRYVARGSSRITLPFMSHTVGYKLGGKPHCIIMQYKTSNVSIILDLGWSDIRTKRQFNSITLVVDASSKNISQPIGSK